MIDIIIPAYNAHDTICDTIDSILNQTIVELINVYVIDDCSNHSYNTILKKYKNKLNLKLHRLRSNKGPGYARQFGIDNSSSPYIMFVDSDDLLYSNDSLEKAYELILNNNYDAIHSVLREDCYGNIYDYYSGFDVLHGKIYKRLFLEERGIKFPYFYNSEDVAFNSLFILFSPFIGKYDDILYVYRRRKNSLTQTDNYCDIHIKYYCRAIAWTIKEAQRLSVCYEKIGKFIISVFSYFSWHFLQNKDEKSKKYIYPLIKYYDKYAFYCKGYNDDFFVDFWSIHIRNNNLVDYYILFVNECREVYYSCLGYACDVN